MGTYDPSIPPAEALFGKTRRQLLALLFGSPERAFYVREILRATDVGQGAVQRELAHLAEADLIRREKRGVQVYYQANRNAPIFPEIRALVSKTAGLGGAVRDALRELGEAVESAFLFGPTAAGSPEPEGAIEVLVIGSVSFGAVVEALVPVEEEWARLCDATVYEADEFRTRLAERNPFLVRVMTGPREVVVGDLERPGAGASKPRGSRCAGDERGGPEGPLRGR